MSAARSRTSPAKLVTALKIGSGTGQPPPGPACLAGLRSPTGGVYAKNAADQQRSKSQASDWVTESANRAAARAINRAGRATGSH
jgi:hypothetical protein